MSKFCNNCGSEMEDDVVFCPNCGAQDAPAYEEAPAAKKEVPVKKLIILGSIAAVIVALIVWVFLAAGPKRAVERFEKVVNGKGKIADIYPDKYLAYVKDATNKSKNDWLDDKKDGYEDDLEGYKDDYGSNVKINYTVVEKKNLSKDDYENLKEYLEESYKIKENTVKGAVRMAVRVDYKGRDGNTFEYEEVMAVNINGKWYVNLAFGFDSIEINKKD